MRLWPGYRHNLNEARVERNWNDVIAAEARPCSAIGRRHFVGHVLAREIGESLSRSDLHFHVDRLGPHVERAAKDVGKAEHVIDLVRVVGAPSRDDHVIARLFGVFRRDFRIGFAIAKMIGFGGMLRTVHDQRALG